MSLRGVLAVVVAGGLAATAASLSPLASGSSGPVPAAAPVAAPAPVVSGVVRAADTRRTIADVGVTAASVVDPRDRHHAVTDAAGRYRFSKLRTGAEYTLRFDADRSNRHLSQYAPGAVSQYRARRYRAPAVVDASLVPGVPVSGRVTTSTGRASADARVLMFPLDGRDDASQGSTDARGRWSTVAAPGRYRVMSLRSDGTSAGFHPGGRSWTGARIVVVGSHGRSGIDLREPAPSRLEVTVTDAATRRPVDDVCVTEGFDIPEPPYGDEPGTQPGGTFGYITLSEGDPCAGRGGRYTIGVDPGTVRAEVTDRWFSEDEERYGDATTAPVRVGVGATARVRVALVAAGTLTGRVVDRITGRPVKACVAVRPVGRRDDVTQGCAAANGTWRVGGLAAGPVTVRVDGDDTHVERYAPGADTEAGAAVYQVRAGATTTVPTVRLERGGTITGRVLDARGRAVAGAGVEIPGQAWWDYPRWTAITDAAGRYRFANVPVGPHKLRVQPPSYTGLGSVWVGGAGDDRGARAVTVPYGRTLSLPDQRLRAGARLAVVLGAVDESVVVEALDPQGRIVGQAPVTLPLRTGRAGRTVTLTGLPATAVRVHAFSIRTDPEREIWLGGSRFATATAVPLVAGRTVTVAMRAPAPVAPTATGAGVSARTAYRMPNGAGCPTPTPAPAGPLGRHGGPGTGEARRSPGTGATRWAWLPALRAAGPGGMARTCAEVVMAGSSTLAGGPLSVDDVATDRPHP